MDGATGNWKIGRLVREIWWMAQMYTMVEFMRCHPTARFISALWTGTKKYPEFRKK